MQVLDHSSALPKKPDVQSSADVERIVKSFYGDIEQDPMLGRFFVGLDWDAHLPRMVAFWSSVTFHTGDYNGRPFDPHAKLKNLESAHFDMWVLRFKGTIDELFEGEIAESMKLKAEQIATVFQVKLGLWGKA